MIRGWKKQADMSFPNEMAACCAILARAKSVLVLTGAGISAESGMPTYRGPGGEYSENPGLPVTLSADVFARDPHQVWKKIDGMRVKAAAGEPNQAHQILAKWETENRFSEFLIATQNIDGLHQKAGSSKVSQLHGSLWQMARPKEGSFADDAQFSEDMKLMAFPEMRDEILQRWSEENQQQIWEDKTVPFVTIPPVSNPYDSPNVLLYDEPYGSRLVWVEDFIRTPPDLVLVIGCSGGISILEFLLRRCREENSDCKIININPFEDCVTMPHFYLPLAATEAFTFLDSVRPSAAE